MPVAQRMTAEEFVAAPVPDRGRPWSLVDGEVVMNEPTRVHGLTQRNILMALSEWARKAPGRGSAELPADIALDDRNVFAPDVLWYSAERVPPLDREPPYPMPDLAVEVRSPSTWRYDLGAKKAGYERHGLAELWLADTQARSVLIYRRSAPEAPGFDVCVARGEADEVTSPLLAGFSLAVAAIFA